MDPIEELITNMTKEGKTSAAISAAVQEKMKSLAPPPVEAPAKVQPKEEPKDPGNDQSLADKVKLENETKQKQEGEKAKLTSALRFVMGADKFIEEHKTILPKEVADIFAKANKESYDSDVEKANAMRAGVIESFFSVQANMDILIPSQKSQIEEYLKLTRKARDEKSAEVFVNVLEPSMHMLKQLKKAEELAKTGRDGTLGEGQAGIQGEIVKRMVDLSKKHYGVK